MTFANRVLEFYKGLDFTGQLPAGIRIMNPFRESADVRDITQKFYTKFYSDNAKRILILGINPGRFGAGSTGIPFTDTIRLNTQCGIPFDKFRTYEPSSSFIYEMIGQFGGVHEFYKKFFVSAICPLGFTNDNTKGKSVNYNYYDSSVLLSRVYPFVVETLKEQLELGIERVTCFCLGTGKNDKFLRKLNAEYGFFKSIITLEHPRYIMQYRARRKEEYITKYVKSLKFEI